MGTGTPNAEPDRAGAATAIVSGDRAYLVDLGAGVVRRASAAFAAGIAQLAPGRLTRAFLTHLHSDHTVGLPDALLTPWVLGRRTPLEVWGPPGTQKMAELIRAAYAEDIGVRTTGLERADPAGAGVVVHEVAPGVVHEDERVRVTAFEVEHGSWEHAYGYRFDAADRSIVVSGDTAPSESLVAAARGCDVLVHEVYCDATLQAQPAPRRTYHSSFHTSAAELGRLAQRIRPGQLVLYHQLMWGCSPEQLVAEVKREFGGPVVFGRDLGVY